MEREITERIAAEAARMEDEAGADRTYTRVPQAKEPSQVYSIRIPVARIEELRELAKRQGLPASVLLRSWALECLDRERSDRSAAHLRSAATQIAVEGSAEELTRALERDPQRNLLRLAV